LRDNLTYSVLDLSLFTHSSLELQGITLIQDNEPLAVINIYRHHPNQLTPFSTLDHLYHLSLLDLKTSSLLEMSMRITSSLMRMRL